MPTLPVTTASIKKNKIERRPIVELTDIVYCYRRVNSRDRNFHIGPIHLEIMAGEILAVLGPSGSGKTTLLRLMAGLESPKQGTLIIDGQKVFDNKTIVLPEHRRVGMMFQEHALFPHLTVRQNIEFGLRGYSKEGRELRLNDLKTLLNLQDYLQRYPHELSGGQQQRVALARTLAPSPKVILLDEPLSSIDADLRASLAQELRSVLKQTATTAIWVTHDQSEALDIADRILVINEGRIEQVDDPWYLYNEPKTRFVADFVGHAVFLQGELRADHITTEIGSVPCPPCLHNSRRFELMVRPDDIRAVPHDAGQGVICKRQFFGATQLYTIQLPSGVHVLMNQPSYINWPIGTKVQVALDMKRIVAFPL